MPLIKAHDEITIQSSADDVWKILIDIPNYYLWWPKAVNLKVIKFERSLVGTEFKANPLGGKSFNCRVISFIPNREIKLEYFNGIYNGEGTWKIETGEEFVKVSYTVDLEIVDKSIIVLSRIISISKIHSMIFKRILKGLEKQVNSGYLVNQI